MSLADGGEVALDMEDHRHEDYEQPKQPKMKAFSGDGQALGSVSSNQVCLWRWSPLRSPAEAEDTNNTASLISFTAIPNPCMLHL